ncbi:cyclodeaminase/cyclohydrolase family protein [Arthrobacter sp. NIO-1057]|uniref:cyclodeaminase/cyclohydrolase family protein n=1 Tax=Arthrobacter sp. NIO-1057 TaxID=993071 RepID=UPI00071E3335|nr:cyclodeaminase/cyclohydrolase family protein [Arthrobacter sp. NIO-1057]KSU66046.1 hypothetical protein AS038_10240 [Arthrobacter sp. NIO-1057]SCC30792.1 Formiminotetrahydrofolate cyclodeaminase [Arthrobacter sp. NIO-1057]
MISTETVSNYLERLASGAPTPGGGAAVALHAAQGAALVSMVAEFTSGPRYADVQEQAQRIAENAKEQMRSALFAAEEDERVFRALSTAYGLRKDTEEQKAERRDAIQHATIEAATPLVSTVNVASAVIELASELLLIGNRSVSSDVAAAAEAARAALGTALVTLEMNIAAIKDETQRAQLTRATTQASQMISQAEEISSAVRSAVSA